MAFDVMECVQELFLAMLPMRLFEWPDVRTTVHDLIFYLWTVHGKCFCDVYYHVHVTRTTYSLMGSKNVFKHAGIVFSGRTENFTTYGEINNYTMSITIPPM